VSGGLYPFAPHYLELGSSAGGGSGHRMHYVDEGQGDPVLMVHGNPSWSFYYRDLISELKSNHRVIAPDHIGCGRSDKPNDDHYEYTLSTRVEDLRTLVDSLDLRNLTLVVHDWGGMIGMTYATLHPEKIKRIVILNTGAFPLPKTKSLPWSLWFCRTPFLGPLLVQGANAFSHAAVRWCVTRKPLTPEIRQGYLAPYGTWKNRIAVLRFVQDIPLSPGDPGFNILKSTEARLAGFADKPCMLVWGEKDFVFDLHFLNKWKSIFPKAKVLSYPDCGHYVIEDAGQPLVHAINEFLGSL